jgi:hypothetical protein
MPVAVKVLKVPKGSPAPDGYTFARTTRGGDIYNKTMEIMSMADLTSMFGSSASLSGSVSVYASSAAASAAMKQASDPELDALAAMMGATSIAPPSFSLERPSFGQGRRKTRRGRKGRKATRRH